MKTATIAALLLAAGAAAVNAQTGTAARPARVTQNCSAVTPETCATAHALRRGINLGNMLDAPREGDWGVKLEPGYIDRAAANFATVRLPVRWTNHAAPTADATIDEQFAQRVDKAVDALLAKGVYVILDVHHYTQITGDAQHPNEFAVDASVLDTRLVNIWRQLAQRYKDRSPKLLFELLNEPHGRLNGEPWNALAARTLAVVRASNPARIVLIGPGEWNGIGELPKLHLPPDRNLIVAIHNYDPFPFTHQGADFLAKPFPTGVACCDAGQRKVIADVLESARRWNQASGYPLHLGEFGTYEAVDMASRESYARTVRDEAERRGIGWTYWELASPSFGMFSPKTGNWHEPIRRALLD
ncbi:MAG: putative endo,4-glucanase, Glycoside Hydrolase Family 5 [Ramlibacter sp.]|nr:putative endo,4-glucanase, Glycoside Hydrolase Family 5 [Ramlibacter sp.]